jgi:hypothetical protein
MSTCGERKKSYEVRIFPCLVNEEEFYKMIICDVEWADIKKEEYDISVRDIFVFPNFRTAVEAMANFCAEGQYPEE